MASVGAITTALLGLSACTTINKVRNAVHDIRGNKATIDSFTTKLQSGAAIPFEATYVTTGSSPATIVYAVQPPHGVAFDDTPSGGTGDTTPVHLIVNASGEFACSQQSSGSKWSCDKLGTVNAATQNKIFDFYTPAHWINFLKEFSLAAGIAGDKAQARGGDLVAGEWCETQHGQASGCDADGLASYLLDLAGVFPQMAVATASTSCARACASAPNA